MAKSKLVRFLVVGIVVLVLSLSGEVFAQETSEPKWELVETVINPENRPTEFIVGVTPNFFSPRFNGSFNKYTIEETYFIHKSYWKDHVGTPSESLVADVEMRADFTKPPEILVPGEKITLKATVSGTGTSPSRGSLIQFEYRADGINLRNTTYVRTGSGPDTPFSTHSISPYFVVPETHSGEISIVAFLWNSGAAKVRWIYREQDSTPTDITPTPSHVQDDLEGPFSGNPCTDPSWELSAEEIEKIKAMPGGISIIEWIDGKAEVLRWGESEWSPAEEKTVLNPGDAIRTGPDSIVGLIHKRILHKGDEPYIAEDIQQREISEMKAENREFVKRWGQTMGLIYGLFLDWRDYEVEEYKQDGEWIGENTEICIGTNFVPKERGFIDLIKGGFRALTEGWSRGSIFSVKTGTTICGIRGSEVIVTHDPDIEKVVAYVLEGHMDVTNIETGVTKSLTDNQKLVVDNGKLGDIQPLSQKEWDTVVKDRALGANIAIPTDPSTPPCTGTSNYAYIESRTMENGKEVRIPVMMCNANDLANMDFSVSYNPGVLDFKDAEKGSLNSNFLFESNEISSGNIKISFASSKGVSGSGSIAILIFDVVGSNGDSSILTGSANTADTSSGSPISITIKPGKVTVGGKKTIYVDDDFTDDPANHKWNTIQEGITDANYSDTVLVYNGTYTENVVLNKTLTLIGEGTPTIDAHGSGDAIAITADECTVKGFTCVNAYPSSYAGIRVESNHNVIEENMCENNDEGIYLSGSLNEIRNNIASSNNRYGIIVLASDGNTISNNTAKNNEYDGIYLLKSNDNRIADNDASNNVEYNGIFVSSSNNNEVRNNVADSNDYNGIDLLNSTDNIISNNTVKNNEFAGIFLASSNNNRIADNDASNNEYRGISVGYSSNNNEVCNNVADSNHHDGINLWKSTDNTIANNTVKNNGYDGISLTNSNDNRIYMNNFLDNQNNVHSKDSTNIWHSTSERTYRFKGNNHTNYLGNYWDDYTGSDTDNDGIGDSSYSIDGDNDFYPLMKLTEDYFPPPCTGTSTYAYIESRTMENGKEVRIPVMMCNANDLANMDFSVSYNPGVLDFKDAEKGSLNSNFLFESNEISSGNIKISFASSKGVSGSGSIAILIFDVVGSNGDSSILTGSANTADTSSGSPISITIKPGKVTVGGKKTIYVDDDFTDDPANHKWNTIQEGITDANYSDTVLVYNGRYTETVVLNKRLTLIGEGMPEIDAQSLGDAINIKAGMCTVKGFNCVNAQPSPYAGIRVNSCNNVIVDNTCNDNYEGIYMLGSSNEIRNNIASSNNNYGISVLVSDGNIISNNTVKENGDTGIYLHLSNDNRIADNDVSNNEYDGISVSCSNNNEVRNNVANSNHYDGINLWDSTDNIISNNTVKENEINGIDLHQESNDNRIADNDVSNNGRGISVCFSNNNEVRNNVADSNYYGIDLLNSTDNIISNNTVKENGNTGIHLIKESNNNEVRNNVADSNHDGIYLWNSTDNIISNNTVKNNEFAGIYLQESNDNRIYMNNFLDNQNNVCSEDSTNIWHSTSERTYRFKGNTHTNYLGNYWDDYTGSDTDNDGIGGISYNINSDNDNYPLKEPVENYFLPIRLEVVPILFP